ncbi:hypothetical protein Bbelb_169900 [Branchiostoma belcheri]|nr:hypothetical protein Bbelb_169900 [Branchiostoma belcheri]
MADLVPSATHFYVQGHENVSKTHLFDPTPLSVPDLFDPTPLSVPDLFDPTPLSVPDLFDPTPLSIPDLFYPTPLSVPDSFYPTPPVHLVDPTPLSIPGLFDPTPLSVPDLVDPTPLSVPDLFDPTPLSVPDLFDPFPLSVPDLLTQPPCPFQIWLTQPPCPFQVFDPTPLSSPELKAASLALRSFVSADTQHDLLRLDNATAVAYVNHVGGTRSPDLAALALEMWSWALERGLTLSATHVPGLTNTLADKCSRVFSGQGRVATEPLSFFLSLNNWTGNALTVDLFASRMNAQLKEYVSWRPEPEAILGVSGLPQGVEHVVRESGSPATELGSAVPAAQQETPSAVARSDACRVAKIRRQLQGRGLSAGASDLILSAWRESTSRQYQSAWAQWASWCDRRKIDPVCGSIESTREVCQKVFLGGLPAGQALVCLHIPERISKADFFPSERRGGEQKLFISFSRPHRPVGSATLARWVKSVLGTAGVDTATFSAHSTRGASTSAATAAGVSLHSIMNAADWSRESTFLKYYRRDNNQHTFDQAVLSTALKSA